MLFSAALRCRYSVVVLHGRRADPRRGWSLSLAQGLQLNVLVVISSLLEQLVVRAGFTHPTFLDEVSARCQD